MAKIEAVPEDPKLFTLQLSKIQKELKAPKSQYNKYGGYKYRSCEDILEGLKEVLPTGWVVTLSDEMVQIGDRYYVKATAEVSRENNSFEVTAYAREPENKKGMDAAQVTGSTSSYARKYALNGLFMIDDTKDADTQPPEKDGPEKLPPAKKGKGKSKQKAAAPPREEQEPGPGEQKVNPDLSKYFTLLNECRSKGLVDDSEMIPMGRAARAISEGFDPDATPNIQVKPGAGQVDPEPTLSEVQIMAKFTHMLEELQTLLESGGEKEEGEDGSNLFD
jgi:hypothetical protein